MRITVNLGMFFHDHRSVARMFINKKMKCIRHLEDRICEIFKIDNFYLKCENQYLPSSESVNILKSDDVVWIIPCSENKTENESCFNFENPEEIKIPVVIKKKKKKKQDEVNINDQPSIVKRKRKYEENSGDTCSNKIKREKKIKSKTKLEKTLSSESQFKDSGRDSCDSSKSEELDAEDKNTSVKSLVHSFENKNNFKKCLGDPEATKSERRINIVKTIIVSNKCNTPNTVSNNTEMKNSHLSQTKMENELLPNPETEESVINTVEHQAESLDNNGGSNIDDTSFKKRRKRVRKRKHPSKPVTSYNNSFVHPVYNLIPRPLLAQTSTPLHVRFEEDPAHLANNSSNEIIDLSTNNENQEKNEKRSNEKTLDNDTVKLSVQNDEITEEFILKQPITPNIQPRLGDIIAFKILRIAETYTPEISSSIVGTVVNCSPENQEITFDIFYGKEQCLQPQGKFSVNLEELPEEENTRYQCEWSNLLEPRLLYP